MGRIFTGAALAALLSGAAAAESITVGDLGAMPSRRACMETAETVLNIYLGEYGGHSVSGDAADPESWALYAWDLSPGDNDVVITCPVVAEQVNAFYIVYSAADSDAEDGDVVAERLRDLWVLDFPF
jgi:hypothetical protein